MLYNGVNWWIGDDNDLCPVEIASIEDSSDIISPEDNGALIAAAPDMLKLLQEWADRGDMLRMKDNGLLAETKAILRRAKNE
jgi:hypothetical protein